MAGNGGKDCLFFSLDVEPQQGNSMLLVHRIRFYAEPQKGNSVLPGQKVRLNTEAH